MTPVLRPNVTLANVNVAEVKAKGTEILICDRQYDARKQITLSEVLLVPELED